MRGTQTLANINIDAQQLPPEDSQMVDDELSETVIVDREISNAVSGLAVDIRSHWTTSFLHGGSFQFGLATGSGTAPDKAPQSQTFRQTGLHSNDIDRHAYSNVLEPKLANLQVLSITVGYAITNYGALSLRYAALRLAQQTDDSFHNELDLEVNGRSRAIGDE